MNPSRASSLMQPVVVLLLGTFVLVFIWGWMSNDDYEDDEFSVTITYDCERVLNERNYPAEVLAECLELRDEIKRRNRQ
jgi:nitrogen fixation-related uncharacterized protein